MCVRVCVCPCLCVCVYTCMCVSLCMSSVCVCVRACASSTMSLSAFTTWLTPSDVSHFTGHTHTHTRTHTPLLSSRHLSPRARLPLCTPALVHTRSRASSPSCTLSLVSSLPVCPYVSWFNCNVVSEERVRSQMPASMPWQPTQPHAIGRHEYEIIT